MLQEPAPVFGVTLDAPMLWAPESTTRAVVGSVKPIVANLAIPAGDSSQGLGRPAVVSGTPESGRPISILQAGPPRRLTEAAAATWR